MSNIIDHDHYVKIQTEIIKLLRIEQVHENMSCCYILDYSSLFKNDDLNTSLPHKTLYNSSLKHLKFRPHRK